MNTAQKIIKNLFSLVFAQIISQLLAFAAIVYLARVLSPESFGKLGFAQAIIAYFMLIVSEGFDILGTREIAKNHSFVKKYVDNIITIRLFLSAFAYLLLCIFVYFINKPLEIKYLTLLYGLGLFTFSFTLNWVFQGVESMGWIAGGRIAQSLVYTGCVFIFIRNSQQLLQIPILMVISGVVALVLLGAIFTRRYGFIKLSFDFAFWKEIFRQALPMGFSFILIQIYYNFDIIMLGFMKGEETVGWYSASYKIVLLLITFGGIVGTTILPVFARYYKESLEKLQMMISSFAKMMIIIAIPIGVGGTILAKPIMNLIYGDRYDPGIIGLQILIWSVVTVYCNVPFAFSLLACNRQKQYMYSVLAGAIINICLNLLLIPKYSLIGAGVATMASEIAVFLMLYYYSRKIILVSITGFLWKSCLASSIMAIFVVLVPEDMNIFLGISIAIVIYSLATIMVRALKKEDFLFIKNILMFKETGN